MSHRDNKKMTQLMLRNVIQEDSLQTKKEIFKT